MTICVSRFWTLAIDITVATGGVDLDELRGLLAACEEEIGVGST